MNKRKMITVKVIGKSGDKTIKCIYYEMYKHPKYERYVRKRTVQLVHDPTNKIQIGNTIKVIRTRKISKLKSLILVE